MKVGDRVRHIGSKQHNIPPGLVGEVVAITSAYDDLPEYISVSFDISPGMIWHEPTNANTYEVIHEK